MNNRRRSEILLKVVDNYFEGENRETQDRFRKHALEICRKEKISLEKIFFVLFPYNLLLVCLVQFITCRVLLSQTKNWKLMLFYYSYGI